MSPGDSTHDVEDIVLATKIRIVAETPGHPAFGLRFATRLPNASNESGLGLDTTDFHATAWSARPSQSVRVVGNVGLGILADPTDGERPERRALTTASRSPAPCAKGSKSSARSTAARARAAATPLPGTESRATMRIGGRVTRGTVRIDGAVLFGMTSRDPGFGFTVGATWVFRGFTVP